MAAITQMALLAEKTFIISITQVLSAIGTNKSATITAPSGIQSGDLIVMADFCSDSGAGLVTPAGFTAIATLNTNSIRMVASYKLAVGTESGATITGMACAPANGSPKLIYVFRGNVPAASLIVGSVNSQSTTGDPTAQTATASSGVAPLVILGFYGATAPVSPRTFTVAGSAAKDAEINQDDTGIGEEADLWLAYKIYNSSPQNAVIDMDDELSQNLISCYIQMAA